MSCVMLLLQNVFRQYKTKTISAKTEMLVCYNSVPLALKSGSFLLKSSPVSWEKVCVMVY